MLQRDDDPDFWQSVTGTIEIDELPIQTAIREVKEETGIDIAESGYHIVDCRQANQFEIRSLWTHRYPPGTKFNTEYVFKLEVSGADAIVLTEHLQYQWLPKSEALQRVWSETNKSAIERFVPDNSVG